MKLFQENVYTDIELADNNEIEVLKTVAQLAAKRLHTDEQEIKSGLLAREALHSSETGNVVLPHAYASDIKKPTLFAFTFTQPVIWGETPAQPINTVIALVMPRSVQWVDYRDDVTMLAKHFVQPADVAAMAARSHDAVGIAHVVNSWLPVSG
ncbi:MAG TPA: hypothetical protein DCW31_04555, partial [Lactobacillus sp.]|nr:hypothetical protein [Lactobacillus sp.]